MVCVVFKWCGHAVFDLALVLARSASASSAQRDKRHDDESSGEYSLPVYRDVRVSRVRRVPHASASDVHALSASASWPVRRAVADAYRVVLTIVNIVHSANDAYWWYGRSDTNAVRWHLRGVRAMYVGRLAGNEPDNPVSTGAVAIVLDGRARESSRWVRRCAEFPGHIPVPPDARRWKRKHVYGIPKAFSEPDMALCRDGK